MQTILITGATSGFGKAIAEKFAADGWHCIITGRRKERLDALAATLSNQYKTSVLPLCFDVRNREETFEQLTNLPSAWQKINVLVNNAGLAAGRDPFDAANIDDFDDFEDDIPF